MAAEPRGIFVSDGSTVQTQVVQASAGSSAHDLGERPRGAMVAPTVYTREAAKAKSGNTRGGRAGAVSPDPTQWATSLRDMLRRWSSATLGLRGEAVVVAVASSMLLFLGVWLAVGSIAPVRTASWFSIGALIGLCLVLHPNTAPAGRFDGGGEEKGPRAAAAGEASAFCFASAVALMLGLFFVLFRPAARFVVGALGPVAAARCLGTVPLCAAMAGILSQVANEQLCCTVLLSLSALGGAFFAYSCEKSAVCVFSSLAGGFGLAMVLHWWGRWGWLILRGIADPMMYQTLAGHWVRMFSHGEGDALEYFLFATLWACLSSAGIAFQRFVLLESSLEEEGSVSPLDQPEAEPDEWVSHYSSQPTTTTLPSRPPDGTASPARQRSPGSRVDGLTDVECRPQQPPVVAPAPAPVPALMPATAAEQEEEEDAAVP